MNKTFEYYYVQQAMDSIDIEDIGNCVIESNTDDAEFYYLIIRTALGITRILEYGPFKDGGFPTYCNESFTQIDYNEGKISKRIEKFLLRQGITQVTLHDDISEVKDKLVNLLTYFNF